MGASVRGVNLFFVVRSTASCTVGSKMLPLQILFLPALGYSSNYCLQFCNFIESKFPLSKFN